MSNQPTGTSIRDDDRGVSTVLGAIILFGFLIVALSMYQAQGVPQQNAETEFQHSQAVRDDLVELRAGILQPGSVDQPQYQTVQLGTAYSTRVFTVNPPAPAGIIRTSEPYPITIAYESNGTVIETIPTRFIEYRPGYNELDRSPIWYDASVLYLDARDQGGGVAVIEDQALVDGGKVRITALQNEFRRSGTGQATLEFRLTEDFSGDIPEGNLSVTIPTRLGEDEWEAKTNLPTDSDVYGGVTDTGDDINNMNIYNLTLNTTANNLTVDTVGVQGAPEEPPQNDAGNENNGNNSGDTGDSTAPQFTMGPAADPNTVDQGESFDPTATLDDTSRGGTDISSATWSDDQSNSGTLLPSDGEFDQPKESVRNTIYTDGWSGGDHTITVRGTDSNANSISDTVTVTIDVGDPLSNPEVAFNDTNDNGVYDDGIDTAYKKNDINTLENENVDLVVKKDVSVNSIDLKTKSVTVRGGVTISTKNKGIIMTATSGDMDISGATLNAGKNKVKPIELYATNGDVDVRDATLTTNGDMLAEPRQPSGTLFVNDNRGDQSDGGTYIENKAGNAASLSLEKGTLNGSPEEGTIIDNT